MSVLISEDVELGMWDIQSMTFTPLTGTAEQMANAVRVTCRMTNARNNSAPLFFGRLAGRTRNALMQEIASGAVQVVVGTHALFQEEVQFDRLALAIVDEQHRFGVHQRMALRSKGLTPHQLVMTATPIPRTLTMALYADMAVSVIDELPRVGRISFRRLTADLADRIEVIVRFLAVLELFKQGYVDLDQPTRFGDIEVTWCAPEDVSIESILIDAYDG